MRYFQVKSVSIKKISFYYILALTYEFQSLVIMQIAKHSLLIY